MHTVVYGYILPSWFYRLAIDSYIELNSINCDIWVPIIIIYDYCETSQAKVTHKCTVNHMQSKLVANY